MASADVAEEVELCAMDNTVLLRFEKEEYIVMHTRALARRHEGHSKLQHLLLQKLLMQQARIQPPARQAETPA